METTMIDVWRIHGNSDHTEGRGPTYFVYTRTRAEVEVLAQQHGVMGFAAEIDRAAAVEFGNGCVRVLGDEVPVRHLDKKVAEALGKLSKAEQDALRAHFAEASK